MRKDNRNVLKKGNVLPSSVLLGPLGSPVAGSEVGSLENARLAGANAADVDLQKREREEVNHPNVVQIAKWRALV